MDETTRIRTRRHVLRGALIWPAMGILAAWARRANAGQAADPGVTAFLERWSERLRAAVAQEDVNEEALLHELAAEVARLDPGAFPPRLRTVFDDMGMKTGPVHPDAVFQVVEVELEPRAVIPPHNHVGYSFVTLSLRGEARARHFEALEGSPRPDDPETPFHVREVQSAWLTRGRTSSLTRSRANIHTFQAGPEGATLLDFGVKFPDPGAGPKTFSVLEISDEPRNPSEHVFPARWLGNIYAKPK